MEKNQLCQALLMLSPVKLYFYQDNRSLFFDQFKIFFIQKCMFYTWERNKTEVNCSKMYVVFKTTLLVF